MASESTTVNQTRPCPKVQAFKRYIFHGADCGGSA